MNIIFQPISTQCSIPYRNQIWFAVETKWLFLCDIQHLADVEEYNTFSSLNDYLLKCAQHMLDIFSTENLSIHHKILIGLKDQFDLHKLL